MTYWHVYEVMVQMILEFMVCTFCTDENKNYWGIHSHSFIWLEENFSRPEWWIFGILEGGWSSVSQSCVLLDDWIYLEGFWWPLIIFSWDYPLVLNLSRIISFVTIFHNHNYNKAHNLYASYFVKGILDFKFIFEF